MAKPAPLPVLALVHDAYATVSDNLHRLLRLGRAPFVLAFILGLAFGAMRPHAWAPVASLATVVAYAWFSFSVLRLVLLGAERAELPANRSAADDGPLIPRSFLGTFMLRALGLAVLMALGIAVMMLVVVYPLAVLPMSPQEHQAMLARPGAFPTIILIVSAVLALLPAGVPVARLICILPATAVDQDTTMAAAWRLSRGHGLRLALALTVVAAPFVLGYAALDATLAMLAAMTDDGDPGFVIHAMALGLATAMAMTATALGSVVIARAWAGMAGGEAAFD